MNDTLEDTLRRELHRYVAPIEEATSSELHAVLRAGRAQARRHGRAQRAAAGIATLAIAATGSFAALSAESASAAHWKLAAAPQEVNPEILAILKDQLPAGTHIDHVTMKAYAAEPDFTGTVGTDLGEPIPLARKDWDKAASWEVTAYLGAGHTITVVLVHAKSETEGNAAANCAADLAAGYVSSCDATIAHTQGTTVPMLEQTSVAFKKSADGTMETGAVANDKPGEDVNPPDVSSYIGPNQRYFHHSVEAHPGGDFLVSVTEQIKTPDLDGFDDDAVLVTEGMKEIVLSPELLAAG
jgi:hypothetical protein